MPFKAHIQQTINDDPREMPAFTLAEAAHYLRIPLATLRSWVRGRYYPTDRGRKFFKPIIELPDAKLPTLSFVNLVEAHVLDAIRREHNIPLPDVRIALDYVRKQFGSPHPLADQKFQTDGIAVFVSRFGKLIAVSEAGQLAMREMLAAHLRRVEHDATGLASRLYPLPANASWMNRKSLSLTRGFPSVARRLSERALRRQSSRSVTRRVNPLTSLPETMAASEDTSKKQSGASLRLPPDDCPSPEEIKGVLMNSPERLIFFVDRSLGRKIIPDVLRTAGQEVRVHDELFAQNAKDEIWLAEAGKQGWIVLTKDKNIRYRAIELQALLTARVRAFVLTARGDLSGAEVG